MEYVVVKGFMVLLFVLSNISNISPRVYVDAATCGGDARAGYASLSGVLVAAMFDAIYSKPVGETSERAAGGGVESTAVCYLRDATHDCATCLQAGMNDLLGNCSGNEHGDYTTDVCSIKFGPETPDNN